MQHVLDAYCERAGPGLWAEPLNALTNLAFIAAAVLILGALRSQSREALDRPWDLVMLAILLFAIGVGSGLWHTFSTRWAELADVLPINLFIALFLFAFLRRALGVGRWAALAAVIGFEGVSFALPAVLSPELLNGSIAYLPAWLLLAGFAVELHRRRHPLERIYWVGAVLFSVSLVFRTVDRGLCQLLPFGTHFIWHLLNAALLYLLLRGLIDHAAGQPVRLSAGRIRPVAAEPRSHHR